MKLLTTVARSWGLELTDLQRDQFALYADELRSWNEQFNLTAITDPDGIAVRHFLDSLRIAKSWGGVPGHLIDVGTGAGFPGLPLKILHPELRLTMVESIEKKATFLRHIAAELGLGEVDVVVARAEAVGREPQHRERYDMAVSRAVAELRVLCEYCLPLVRPGGRFLAPKGGQIAQEVELARGAIAKLGGQIAAVEPVELPEIEPRSLVVIDKIAPTSAQYPRAVGIPTKRPL
ncbi:16S rRNA (guanine(527)-N(7))-methyltransferase RsmG [Chloroflexia bacterium SDU3-3]|nr:16S rRNA (guanine(527)-N(7))-methyltransferase RsmG [Chloroflexia bacterium SDU3-3]